MDKQDGYYVYFFLLFIFKCLGHIYHISVGEKALTGLQENCKM